MLATLLGGHWYWLLLEGGFHAFWAATVKKAVKLFDVKNFPGGEVQNRSINLTNRRKKGEQRACPLFLFMYSYFFKIENNETKLGIACWATSAKTNKTPQHDFVSDDPICKHLESLSKHCHIETKEVNQCCVIDACLLSFQRSRSIYKQSSCVSQWDKQAWFKKKKKQRNWPPGEKVVQTTTEKVYFWAFLFEELTWYFLKK